MYIALRLNSKGQQLRRRRGVGSDLRSSADPAAATYLREIAHRTCTQPRPVCKFYFLFFIYLISRLLGCLPAGSTAKRINQMHCNANPHAAQTRNPHTRNTRPACLPALRIVNSPPTHTHTPTAPPLGFDPNHHKRAARPARQGRERLRAGVVLRLRRGLGGRAALRDAAVGQLPRPAAAAGDLRGDHRPPDDE